MHLGADDGCKSERNSHLDTVCKHFRFKRGAKNTRQVFSNDVENPRHVVDRAENDKTGFRSPKARTMSPGSEPLYYRHTGQLSTADSGSDNNYAQYRSPKLDQKLWPGGEVLYSLDPAMSKITYYHSINAINS